VIGTFDAKDINYASEMLQQLVTAEKLAARCWSCTASGATW
jgi:hypothetical protein